MAFLKQSRIKRVRLREKGSITPFCAVSLSVVASLLLVLLESARVYGLDCCASWKAEAAIDSLCAEYQPLLWQQYGLLLLDGAYGTEDFSMSHVLEQVDKYMEKSCNNARMQKLFRGIDLFLLSKGEVLLEGYALATDEEGEIFLTYVAEREKENLPLAVAEDVYRQYKGANELAGNYSGVEESITNAQQLIEDVKLEWTLKGEKEEEVYLPDTFDVEGVLDGASRILSKGTLNMVFADLTHIETKVSKPESELRYREKEKGNMSLNVESDWYQRLLVLSYLENYFSNYLNVKNEHFLKYEMEYVLCGRYTEWENLAETLEKILLIREAGNVAYLLQDKEKMQEIEGLAGLIGWMAGGNPAVTKVVEIGLVGAWAYMESILDVRSLLAGEVIPLIKQQSEWTTDLSGIFSAFDNSVKAKPCEKGLEYADYIKQLICFMDKKSLAYRMMEVMEMSMKSREIYANSRMDHMLVMLRCKMVFESKPLFSSLVSEGNAYRGNYRFTKKVERSYVP